MSQSFGRERQCQAPYRRRRLPQRARQPGHFQLQANHRAPISSSRIADVDQAVSVSLDDRRNIVRDSAESGDMIVNMPHTCDPFRDELARFTLLRRFDNAP